MTRIQKDYMARLHNSYVPARLMGQKVDKNAEKCSKVSNNVEKTGLCGAEVGV